MTAPWSFAVLGPGGVGGLLGGLLDRTGHAVTYLAGEETAATLNRDGLRVRSAALGDLTVPARATAVLAEPVQACLVAVKATQLDAALQRVPAGILGAAVLVPFLNGVEHVGLLRRRYPAAQVVAATIRVESTRVAPGRIEHTSPFAIVELAASPASEALAAHLRAAGLAVTVRDDERSLLWSKLVFLAPFALVTADAGEPLGVARAARRADLLGVLAEAVAAARAEGVAADDPAVDEQAVAAQLDAAPAAMRSSLQRDAEAGRPMELDAIGGAILRAAARAGLPAPITGRLVDALRARLPGGSAASPTPRPG